MRECASGEPKHEAAALAALDCGEDPNEPESWPLLAQQMGIHRVHPVTDEILALHAAGEPIDM